MDESPCLDMDEVVLKAISDFLVDNDHSALVTGFVAVVETVNEDGSCSVFTLKPGSQLPHTCLGLMSVADAEFREDITMAIYAGHDCEEE